MRSQLVIIDGVFRKDSAKVLHVERDQMISALAPDRPDQAFSISVLPGRAERGGVGPTQRQSAWCALLQDIELMPQYQDFGFQPPPRFEAVAQHADEKVRQLQSCDDHALIRY